jgi:hypothetical protein
VALLEGWAQQAIEGVTWADHTYVKCPDNGQFFDCWANNHTGPDQRRIVSGNGSYGTANCYRCSIGPIPDTACIGIYAVDGLCHQSTNCFLFSAGVALNLRVRGYWLSLLFYGPYGREFWRWLALYGWCYWFHPRSAGEEGGAAEPPAEADEKAADSVPAKMRKLHAAHMASSRPPHPHERIIDEVAALTTHHLPDFKADKIKPMHADFLKRKDAVVASGLKGKRLVDEINELGFRAQEELAKRVGKDEYKQLMSLEPGETVNLVELSAADLAGRPVPVRDAGT